MSGGAWGRNLGYAFVNFVNAEAAVAAWRCFDGFSDWALPSQKVCAVSWSGPHQGLEQHVERYRNSPVMHKSVPDEYRPVVFENGVRQRFPSPTRSLKKPDQTHRNR
ncbi:mei2 [Symbiodinium natans]|uniref:Mei2 protein n=1 Tax=Symbiodinium natans TaxID=878477 RepID=A0A812Q0Z5_9DINO|nr:mei2 [Symbiodinium natans]